MLKYAILPAGGRGGNGRRRLRICGATSKGSNPSAAPLIKWAFVRIENFHRPPAQAFAIGLQRYSFLFPRS